MQEKKRANQTSYTVGHRTKRRHNCCRTQSRRILDQTRPRGSSETAKDDVRNNALDNYHQEEALGF